MWHHRLAAVLASLSIASLVGCSSAGSGASSTVAPEDLDLSGSWVLNVERSDDPQQMMQERLPFMADGGRRRPMGDRDGRGGVRGGASSRIDPQQMQQTMRIATNAPRRIVVSQQDSTITIRDAGGRTLMMRTDWDKVRQEIPNGGQIDIRARWSGCELQIEREVHLGGKILQKYSLSSDKSQLHVETQLEMGRTGQPRVFHHVYDAAPRSP